MLPIHTERIYTHAAAGTIAAAGTVSNSCKATRCCPAVGIADEFLTRVKTLQLSHHRISNTVSRQRR